MDTETLLSKLHDHMVNEILLCDESLGPDDDLFDAGFDSMSLTRTLVYVEEAFGVLIPDEDVVLDEISTLRALTDLVAKYMNAS